MRWRWYFVPLYVWSFPHTLLGLLLCLYYWPRAVRWNQGCLEMIPRNTIIGGKWVGAQTWGWLIFYKDESCRGWTPLRVHERVHVIQSFYGSLFYILAYGLHFLWLWAIKGIQWKEAYYQIWFEKMAYKAQSDWIKNRSPEAWGAPNV